MKIKLLLLAGVLALVAIVPTSALGFGSDPTSKALFASKIAPSEYGVRHGDSARLKIRYRCTKGDHLWVSVKQSADRKKDLRLEGEGSSALAATWLQSHRNKFTCNGKVQTQAFNVDKLEQGKGKLKNGWAYVQFCITTGDELTTYLTGWVASYK